VIVISRRRILSDAFALFTALVASSALGAGEPSGQTPAAKVLIEFGWDEPDTAFMRRHIAEMETAPFDGCVYHVLAQGPNGTVENVAWKAWSRHAFTEAELAEAREDLRATTFRSFTSNFLRLNTTPADLDWFDDHAAFVANARLMARLAREGRSRGILLDTEQYEGAIFDYRKQGLKQKRSWEEYAAQARKRGREVMAAFQEGFPGLTVLLTFGPSLVRYETEGGKTKPQDTHYGLLAPFVEGMCESAQGDSRIVDGHESSYGYREPKRFDAALATIRAANPAVQAAFGLWLDYDWRAKAWHVDEPSKNYFTPQTFEASVRAALERSDGIVWVYGETPRWWSEKAQTEKLPTAYLEALRRARRGLAPD
jgi:hypothetical protein